MIGEENIRGDSSKEFDGYVLHFTLLICGGCVISDWIFLNEVMCKGRDLFDFCCRSIRVLTKH